MGLGTSHQVGLRLGIFTPLTPRLEISIYSIYLRKICQSELHEEEDIEGEVGGGGLSNDSSDLPLLMFV